MRRRASLPFSLALAAIGVGSCGRAPSLMPLDRGRTWTYSLYNGLQTYIEPVEVQGPVAVGSGQGAVLSGPMGTSRLGWSGDTLLAARLANSGFSPPIPLAVIAGGKGEAKRKWRGTIEAFGIKRDAFATLTQTTERRSRGGERYMTTKTELQIQAQEETGRPTAIEVTTWFRPGIGIVEQVQRTNRKLIVAMKLLDGG